MSRNKIFHCAYFSMHFRIKFLLFNDFPSYLFRPNMSTIRLQKKNKRKYSKLLLHMGLSVVSDVTSTRFIQNSQSFLNNFSFVKLKFLLFVKLFILQDSELNHADRERHSTFYFYFTFDPFR